MGTDATLAPNHNGGARTSALLLRAVEGEAERISVGEIADALDARAFGLAVLIFSLPSVVPMPPGVPTIVGVALLIVSIQMVLGRQELWLPRFMASKSFSRKALVSGLAKTQRRLESIEKLAKPRLLFMTGPAGTVLVGLVVLLMAIILILPLPPGGNFPPALACAVLGMGLAERDGVIVIIGLVGSIVATVAVTIVTIGFVAFLPRIYDWFGQTFGF
jgi:hypothetical protein